MDRNPLCAAVGVKNGHVPRGAPVRVPATTGHVLRRGQGLDRYPLCAAVGVTNGHVPRGAPVRGPATTGHVLRRGRGLDRYPLCAAVGVKNGHVPREGRACPAVDGPADYSARGAAPRIVK